MYDQPFPNTNNSYYGLYNDFLGVMFYFYIIQTYSKVMSILHIV